jgi:hypothetical protein
MAMDTEKSDYDSGVTAQALSHGFITNGGNLVEFDPKVVRKLRLKIDFIILPTLAIMYTFK